MKAMKRAHEIKKGNKMEKITSIKYKTNKGFNGTFYLDGKEIKTKSPAGTLALKIDSVNKHTSGVTLYSSSGKPFVIKTDLSSTNAAILNSLVHAAQKDAELWILSTKEFLDGDANSPEFGKVFNIDYYGDINGVFKYHK